MDAAKIAPITTNQEDSPSVIEHPSKEIEHIVEYGGPNNRYARLNVILGKGAYKVVWKALDLEEGIESTKNEFTEFAQEIEILKKVRHSNVITFHDSWYSNGEFVFITELMTSGTLREYIAKFKSPNLHVIKLWSRQVLRGLHYLHSQSPPVIHRDIKCDNIFINGTHGEVKIGDMGTAKMKFGRKYTVIGTPEFMAPEMYEEKGYSEKVDIYAFGMCLLEMVTGDYPYSECKNAAQIYKKVSQGIRPECLTKVEDKDILAIINSCLAPENERWSARKLLENPVFAEDPEVSLIAVAENRTLISLQLCYKGLDKHAIKFEFNTEKDTAELVVKEMIEENVLASKYQSLVTGEIHRILREVAKVELSPIASSPTIPPGSPPKTIRTEPNLPLTKKKSITSPIEPKSLTLCDPIICDSNEVLMTREYPDETPIEEFVTDVAVLVNRGMDKAFEWFEKLKSQDIMRVGDLRSLTESDWIGLGLTVFCSRALRNALNGKSINYPSSNMTAFPILSPKSTGLLRSTMPGQTLTPILEEESVSEPTINTTVNAASPNISGSNSNPNANTSGNIPS